MNLVRILLVAEVILLREMNLIDKFTNIHFAFPQPVPILRLGGNHEAAHGDLDKALIFGSNCIYLLPVGREQDIQYELLVLLHSDTLHLSLDQGTLRLIFNHCLFWQFFLFVIEINIGIILV